MKRLVFLCTMLCIAQFTFAQTTTSYGSLTGSGGLYNSNFGYGAGRITTGNNNSFLGSLSGYFNTTGHDNVFSGHKAGYKNTTGFGNVFNGFIAGENNTTGDDNVFVGNRAGTKNSTGYQNTFLGTIAGNDNTNGTKNVFLGYGAGYKNTTGNANVFIGYRAGFNATGSNKLYIDNTSTASPLIYGDFSANGVGINTNKLSDGEINYTLSVNGKVRATEVKVYTGWADYVFEEDYKLRSLQAVEQYIKQYKHLPDVPSAKVVEKQGIFVGEMHATLLRKIEELTLYIIQLEKDKKTIKTQYTQLNARLKTLENLLQNSPKK